MLMLFGVVFEEEEKQDEKKSAKQNKNYEKIPVLL